MGKYEIELKISYTADSEGHRVEKGQSYANKPKGINYSSKTSDLMTPGDYNTVTGMLYNIAQIAGQKYNPIELSGGYRPNKDRSKNGLQMLVSDFYEPFGKGSDSKINRCERCFAPIPKQTTMCLNCSSGVHRN